MLICLHTVRARVCGTHGVGVLDWPLLARSANVIARAVAIGLPTYYLSGAWVFDCDSEWPQMYYVRGNVAASCNCASLLSNSALYVIVGFVPGHTKREWESPTKITMAFAVSSARLYRNIN